MDISLEATNRLITKTHLIFAFPVNHYRSINVIVSNLTFNDVKSLHFSSNFAVSGTFLDTFYIKDSKFVNSTGLLSLTQYASLSSVTMENVEYSNIMQPVASSTIFTFNMKMNLINCSFINTTLNPFSTNPPMLVNVLDFSVLVIDGLRVEN